MPADVQRIFSYPSDANPHIWVFTSGTDVQQIFQQALLGHQKVTSLAHIAADPQHMASAISQDPQSAGLITRSLLPPGLKSVYTIPNIPVLALVKSEPQGLLKSMLSCLQKQK